MFHWIGRNRDKLDEWPDRASGGLPQWKQKLELNDWKHTFAEERRLEPLLLRNVLLAEADRFVLQARDVRETIDMICGVSTRARPRSDAGDSALYVLARYVLLPHLARSRNGQAL